MEQGKDVLRGLRYREIYHAVIIHSVVFVLLTPPPTPIHPPELFYLLLIFCAELINYSNGTFVPVVVRFPSLVGRHELAHANHWGKDAADAPLNGEARTLLKF